MNLPAEVLAYLATLEPGFDHRIEVTAPHDLFTLQLPAGVYKVAAFTDPASAKQWRVTVDQPAISAVVIDLNRREVIKTIGRYAEFGILAREVHWLRALANSGVTPRLLSNDAGSLTLRYVGEPVRQYNLPTDWREQAERILAALAAPRCRHNDIKCDNLTVLDGKLSLLDFGWATGSGESIPEAWPKGIGRQHRLDTHLFDDRHAIFAALASAERDEVDRSIVMPQ